MANVKVDTALLDEAIKLSGCQTKLEVAMLALEEYIQRQRRKQEALEAKPEREPA